jgi:hypothetical protein
MSGKPEAVEVTAMRDQAIAIREPLRLDCRACDRVTVLDPDQQTAILAELTKPAHSKVLDCRCGRYQFALTAGPIRRQEVSG